MDKFHINELFVLMQGISESLRRIEEELVKSKTTEASQEDHLNNILSVVNRWDVDGISAEGKS